MSNQKHSFKNAPLNTIPAIVLILTPIAAVFLVPWYLMTHEVSLTLLLMFIFFVVWTGISITAGYHRLLAHRSYETHPVIKYFLLLGATFAIQSSAFDWCSGHRTHHRFVDDKEKDPYSVRRGFWFSHIGWMLRKYPSGNYDYKNIPDLKKDKILQIQHKYYGFWVLFTNVGILSVIGLMIGDILGTLILVGLLRIVLTHHSTFFINSLCHMFGSRPYTDTNTARDNFILAFFTWGEGYHNYHHYFEYDYRNGVKWWQYDPTKWFIAGLAKVRLAKKLRTVDTAIIRHAQIKMRLKKMQYRIDKFELVKQKMFNLSNQMEKNFTDITEKRRLAIEAFNQSLEEWQALKTNIMTMKKQEFAARLQEVETLMRERCKNLEKQIINEGKQLEILFQQLQQPAS